MFYFNKPLDENSNDKNKNDPNTKVEKIMPEVEDLDNDPN